MQKQLAASFSFERLMKSAGDSLEKAGQAIKGLFK